LRNFGAKSTDLVAEIKTRSAADLAAGEETMAATLTADPNPVGIWAPPGPGTIHIKWNTDSNNKGKVYVRINAGEPDQVAGGDDGAVNGEFDYTNINLDNTYVFILRRVGGNQPVLATVTVTAYDLQEELTNQTLEAILFANQLDPPQAIYGLRVEPGVDTVRVSFRTRLPTIPFLTIETLDGEKVASWFPLFGGLRTRHVNEFGWDPPLAQGTKHRVRITVPRHMPLLGAGTDVVRTAEFVTGTRVVDVLFDHVKVLKDGDPSHEGASDFEFEFAAGNASNLATMVEFGPFKRDIDQDDPPVAVEWNIPLFDGPRDVWVGVAGIEWDGNLYPGIELWGVTKGLVGSRAIDRGNIQGAVVGQNFDLSGVGFGATTIPFELSTGDFDVAFKVFGRIWTVARAGQGWWQPVEELPVGRRPGKLNAITLKEPGAKGMMNGTHGAGTLLGLDAEGRIWQRPIDPERPEPRHEGWALLAPAPGGAVTGLRFDDGRVELFGLDAVGSAQCCIPGEQGREGGWRSLGGTFVGALVAVAEPEGRIALFGVAADGRVRRRALAAGAEERSEWEDLGGAVAGGLIALQLSEAGPVLLAIDRAGQVVHCMAGRNVEWRSLGGPRAGWLAAQPVEGGGIMLVVLTEEGVVHRLLWRDHPDGEPEGAWEELGTFDDLMPLQPLPAPKAQEPEDSAKIVPTAA
jgi:hypothetical protein